ncbi:MAG: 30S ribosomal protein S4 [Brevinemataceae bacterium]
MQKNGPKVRISRYLGIAITKKAAKIMEKKPYGPGQAAATKKFRGKMSVHKTQLLEKQKIRAQYNISEKQMRDTYYEAARLEGNTVELLAQLLERRLDAFVYRAGFAPTIYAARQAVSHGHFLVNGKKVNIPSYRIKSTDIISVKEKSKNKDIFIKSLGDGAIVIPAYIERDTSKMEAKFTYFPTRTEIPIIGDIPLIIEYYSR